MIQRIKIAHGPGFSVVPNVSVSEGKAQLQEMQYRWEGVAGTAPPLSIDLKADSDKETFFMAAVYQSSSGERKVVVDSGPILGPAAMQGSSADAVLDGQGWTRCFMIFQVFLLPGQWEVTEENAIVQVFEHTEGAPVV